MNEVIQAIKQRRSCRKFTAEPVSREQISQIAEAGLYAPSGMGKQSAKLLVITKKDVIARLSAMNAQVLGRADFDPFYGAPVVIVALAPRGWVTAAEDGNLALENVMIAAQSFGLGTCYIHRAKAEFDSEAGKQFLSDLGIEGDWEGVGHVIVGHAADPAPSALERKSDRVVFVE